MLQRPTGSASIATSYGAFLLMLFAAAMTFAPGPAPAADTVVIAHRGASGYLPEHTLAAYAMAYAQGADYLEPDIVLTQDGHPIALHDLYLDAVTDVRAVYPGRARADGLHYAIDFTLEEIRALRVHERVVPETGEPRYPTRFPPDQGRFDVVTLPELIELVQGLNRATGREVGIYPELKAPAFHAEHGQDIAAVVLATVDRYGYTERDDACIIQSFEPEPLVRLRHELGSRLRLVQLLGENDWKLNDMDYEPMYTDEGLAQIATYADGIGPPLERLVARVDEHGRIDWTPLLSAAQRHGLAVHPFTFRADSVPERLTAIPFDTLVERFIDAGVDGLFIYQPDLAVDIRDRLRDR
jgi:glycerophosphoryl diester phosphodiesterase